MTELKPLMERNFLEYASYVIIDRAIPDLRDGLKPVQRRILATLFKVDDGKFHKVANIIGDTMKLHPHGDASIGDALVVLANKEYFIEKQGNFGNIITGHSAAASRYIECRLTDLARETLFSKELTETRPSYDGRTTEPVFLPAKLPILLMLGTEGIAVGMATRILPHNFCELLQAQIAVLKSEPFELLPDFANGGLVDVTEYDDGRGKVRVRARIDVSNEKTVVIREVPFGTTTESLLASIENAALKGKVKIASIDDFTTDTVEIEIDLPRGVYADEVVPQLYAHTDCEVSVSSNMVMIRDRHPVELSVTEVLCILTDNLRGIIKAELELELGHLEDTRHWLTLERIFIENRIYKRIEEATTAEAVKYEVYAGLEAFEDLLVRAVTDDDIERLLKIPIRRISQYDIDRNREEITKTKKAIAEVNRKLRKLTATTIAYLESILERFGENFPRRTEITTFKNVDVRAVARQNLRASYDPETGFFGTAVKGEKYQLQLSEYDKVLIISKDGSYRIISPEEKVLIPGKVIYLDVFDPDEGVRFTVVYRDKGRITWAKKVHIRAFIRDREYELIKDKEGRIDLLLPGDSDDCIHMDFVPAKRQRVREGRFDLSILDLVGASARGRRLAPKPVLRLRKLRKAEVEAEAAAPSPELPDPPETDQPSLFDEE
ncbi:MAG: DNA topoisomerase IV subunit A [Thermoanaerobaculales bacterium]|nr:DNA topoisomerase IV subunit A [Thermoanaerobaculales bacterium]